MVNKTHCFLHVKNLKTVIANTISAFTCTKEYQVFSNMQYAIKSFSSFKLTLKTRVAFCC